MTYKVYIGWDKKNALAYDVCVSSIRRHTASNVTIYPLQDWQLRYRKLYWRSYIVDQDGQMIDRGDNSRFSTEFAFTRFLVPALNNYRDEWVLFIDSDMMFRADIAELFSVVNDNYAMLCVQHENLPYEDKKMFGLKQTYYKRKNWSSLMLMNTARCNTLTLYAVNNWTGEALHAIKWLPDNLIGNIPVEWNYLVGQTDPSKVKYPKNVHFTLGTPDMPECAEVPYAVEWFSYVAAIK